MFRVWSYLDSKFLQGANCVLTLDDQIRDKLIELHPYLSATGRIEIVPLTLGLKLKESMCIEQNPIALDLRIADRDVVVAYSGNMGIGHDFDMFKQKTLARKIKFVFIGGGTAHDELRSLHSDNSQFVLFGRFIRIRISSGSTVSAGFSDNLSGSQCRCATGAK